MRMLVVGAGATGGYFGGRLAQAGRDVTFLARGARAAQLQSSGLQIVSPHGDASLAPKLVRTSDVAGPFDVVLVALKAYSLVQALEDFAPAVGPDTVIVPLLNGMRHMELLTERFGQKAVIGGLCKIAATLDDAGRIVQLAAFHDLVYGEWNGVRTPRIEKLDAFMAGAGFDARLSSRIEADMWDKWVMMAALGGVTCLMRGNVGEVIAAPGGTEFAEALVNEVVTAASALKHPPAAEWVGFVRSLVTTAGSPLVASMYRDMLKTMPIEADQIIGDLLFRAGTAGVSTPLLATIYTHLRVYQSRIS